MALSAKVGIFNTTTNAAGNTVSVSGLGFQPKVILFWWVGRTGGTDGVAAGYRAGFGAAISSTERYTVAINSKDNAASADSSGATIDDGCIALVNEGGTDTGTLDFQSMDADGFTLVIDTACTTNHRVAYLALGGADLTNYKIGRIEWPAGTGNTGVTGVGFQPDLVIGVMGGTSTVPSRSGTVGEMSISAAASSSAQYALSFSTVDGAPTMVTNSYNRSGDFLSTVYNDGFDNRGTFVSMDSDGFTYNRLATNFAGAEGFYIALKGGSYELGDLLTQTDTTTAIAESGFGFSPVAVMFLSHGMAQSAAGTADAHAIGSIGAGTSTTNRAAMGIRDTDAQGNSVTMNGVEGDEVYVNLDADAYIGQMDIQSIDSDGFTCIMDDADPSQAFVWYIAFGDAATGTEYTQSVSGTLTSAGALTKQTGKVVSGSLTSIGALVKLTSKTFAGTLASSGALTKQAGKVLGGTLTSGGEILKQAGKSLGGTLSSSGALTTAKVALKSLEGTLSMAGTLTRQAGKSLGGTLTPTGDLSRSTAKFLNGTLTAAGTLSKQVGKVLSGVLSWVGILVGVKSEAVTGGVSLTLNDRSIAWQLSTRSVGWTVNERTLIWTVEEK